jgi:hypothetical protein
MRDLIMEELPYVYGGGGRGKAPCPPSKPPRCGRGSGSRGGSRSRGGSHSRGRKRCGRGGGSS